MTIKHSYVTLEKSTAMGVMSTLGIRKGRIAAIISAFIGWYVIAYSFPFQLMPFPIETIQATVDLILSGIVWPHLYATGVRTILGFLGAMLLSITFGVVMGTTRFGQLFLTPYVLIGLAVPAIAWAAIMTIVFGISEMTPITATLATVFPFTSIIIWKGVENIDGDLIQMSSSFDISSRRLLTRMILPNIASPLFAASRLGLAITWKIVTVTEIFASSSGIGYQIITTYRGYMYTRAFAWAIIFMIIILLMEYRIFKPLERRIFRYRQDVEFSRLG